MKYTLFLSLIASLLVLVSCKAYLDQPTRLRIEASQNMSLDCVQFFTDKKMILVYESDTINDKINQGAVTFVDGRYYYRIKIPKNTRAIAKSVNKNALNVYFEQGKNRHLSFYRVLSGDSSRYQLYSKRENNEYFVNYDGYKMKVVKGDDTKLQMKRKVRVLYNKRKRKIKGLRVTQ